MATTPRRRSGFSPTTVILVLVLLGAVAGASRLVTPPPPGPPKEVKAAAPSPPMSKEEIAKMQKHQLEMQKHEMENMDPKKHDSALATGIPPVEDPNRIDVSSKYFLDHKPGEAGLSQVDKEVAVKSARYKAYLHEVEVAQAKKKAATPK